MDYQSVTVWTVIKRFLMGWLIEGIVLVVISCVEYKEYILYAFTNNILAWINAIIPIVIIVFGIRLMLRSLFR